MKNVIRSSQGGGHGHFTSCHGGSPLPCRIFSFVLNSSRHTYIKQFSTYSVRYVKKKLSIDREEGISWCHLGGK
jgi:hypothetical protein